jgi:hypothetical protein
LYVEVTMAKPTSLLSGIQHWSRSWLTDVATRWFSLLQFIAHYDWERNYTDSLQTHTASSHHSIVTGFPDGNYDIYIWKKLVCHSDIWMNLMLIPWKVSAIYTP